MIIKFYLFVIIIILLFLFGGIGLTLIICPKNLLKYSLVFAPFICLIYFSFFCWIFVNYSQWGTNVYANFLLIPPAICLIIVYFFKRSAMIEAIWPLKRENIAIFGLCLAIIFIISLPYVLTLSNLNAITLGNSDIANYASVSAFLTQGTLLNNVVGADPWILGLIPNVFSAHISLAVPSSIIHTETYQLFNLVLYIFFGFSLPFVFIIAKDIFKFCDNLALIVTGLVGINFNLILIIYHGYLSQIIGMGYFLSMAFLTLVFIQRQEKIKALIYYIPLFALLLSGLIVTYPTFLPLFFIPLAFYLACEFIWIKRLVNVLDLVAVFFITGLISVILFPILSLIRFNELMSYSNVIVGFNANPLFPSWIMGMLTEIVQPDQLMWIRMTPFSAAGILLSVLVGIVVFLSFRYLYLQNKDLFTISIFFGIFLFSFYLFLIYKELTAPEYTGEGYKAYKLITYFIPFFVIVGLAYFNKFNFQEHYNSKKIVVLIVLILFIGFNIFSAAQIISVNYQRNIPVNPSIIELQNIRGVTNITSINVDDPDVLTSMWIYHFIFLQKKTYSSYHHSPLLGDWTIKRGTDVEMKNLQNNLTNESIVRVNTDYYLVKA